VPQDESRLIEDARLCRQEGTPLTALHAPPVGEARDLIGELVIESYQHQGHDPPSSIR